MVLLNEECCFFFELTALFKWGAFHSVIGWILSSFEHDSLSLAPHMIPNTIFSPHIIPCTTGFYQKIYNKERYWDTTWQYLKITRQFFLEHIRLVVPSNENRLWAFFEFGGFVVHRPFPQWTNRILIRAMVDSDLYALGRVKNEWLDRPHYDTKRCTTGPYFVDLNHLLVLNVLKTKQNEKTNQLNCNTIRELI